MAAETVTDDSGPLFVKVYAGKGFRKLRDFDRAVSRNLKKRAEIPDATQIDCEPGERYGLGVIVSVPGKQFVAFETTAIWRDLDDYDAPRRSHREHALNKKEFGTRRFFFKMRDGDRDHDMTFVIHDGNRVFLRHRFLIRGCPQTEPTD